MGFQYYLIIISFISKIKSTEKSVKKSNIYRHENNARFLEASEIYYKKLVVYIFL